MIKKTLFSFLVSSMGLMALAQSRVISQPDGRQMAISTIDSMVKKLMDTAEVTGLCLGIVQNN